MKDGINMVHIKMLHQRPHSQQSKQWCNHCESHTHNNTSCRQKKQRDTAWKGYEESGSKEYTFQVSDKEVQEPDTKRKGLMVDAGATSHIVMDILKFKKFDDSFRPRRTAWSWLMAPGAVESQNTEVMWRCGCLQCCL